MIFYAGHNSVCVSHTVYIEWTTSAYCDTILMLFFIFPEYLVLILCKAYIYNFCTMQYEHV